MRFDSGTDSVAIGAASFPRGETHKDEFFGEQEIYRGKFAIAIPYKRTGAAQTLDLNLRLQGCADLACFEIWTATIALPAAAARRRGTCQAVRRRPPPASSATDGLLPVDQASQ